MKLAEITKELDSTPGIDRELVENVESEMGIVFPEEYVNFVLAFNGVEGPIGEHSYLALWPVESLALFNRECEVDQSAPGLLIFGSDGAGTAYAFDTTAEALRIVEVPFIGMSVEDAIPCAETFIGFLEYLYTRD